MTANIRLNTYVSPELYQDINEAAEEHDMSVSELLREGAKRQLQQLDVEACQNGDGE